MSFFEPEAVDATAPSIAPSTPKCCRLFISPFSVSAPHIPYVNELVPVIPPPANNELVPVFPPCDEDDYGTLDDGNTETTTRYPPSNAPTPTAASSTTSFPNPPLFSTYDYIARCDVSPLSIPDGAKQIIISTIIAISSIRSPQPF